MKAQIFHLKSQQELCKTIEYLLRDNLFSHIAVERLAVRDDCNRASSKEEHKAGASYLGLLKASMISVDDFRIAVSDRCGNWWEIRGASARLTPKIMKFPPKTCLIREIVTPPEAGGTLTESGCSGRG